MNSPLWFSNLAFWSAQVALLVLTAGFLPRLLQIGQPRILLAFWRALLAICLALPFIQPWHPLPAIVATTITPQTVPANIAPPVNPAITHWQFPNLQTIAQLVAIIVLVGIAARFVILALGLLKLRQLRLASAPISSFPESAALLEQMRCRVDARADFRLSGHVDSPVTFGFAAPVILLTERFPSMDSRFQCAIACHELLHVRRHDWAHHLAEEIVRAIFWFHPAIGWLIARVRLAREQVVDLEVVALTHARRTYLEALLEFTANRTCPAAVPAPPFLAERQLAERIALMLKEVRMSRNRLIASVTVIACCLTLAVILAAWTFPLKGAPRPTQSKPIGGVVGGIAGGVASGVSGGIAEGLSSRVASGISGGISRAVSGSVSGGIPGGINGQTTEPTVSRDSIWTDTVKRGPMLRQVRGLGTLVHGEDSQNLVARVTLPASMAVDVRPNQNATVDTRKGLVKGHVIGISEPSNDMRNVIVGIDGSLPEGAGLNLPVDATIDIEKLDNILSVGRPVHGAQNASISVFKLLGNDAERVKVRFGRASVQRIEVLEGLKAGDQIILSDMSEWENVDRIHLK
jgi:beta-lactamase regulating signal transducer with metallopeptidase domain